MSTMHELIKSAKHIVVFSGAGFSTESDIPDFRSASGIYRNKTYPYPCEQMISKDFFIQNTKQFYDFYKNEMVYLKALPNRAHKAIAKLEMLNKLESVITQNIDGLHQMAGNKKVIELHGSIHRNYCMNCHQFYDLNTIVSSDTIPYCAKCHGVIKPDVVLYQESLDENVLKQAVDALSKSDLLIIAGTSLTVYPAAGLIQYYHGEKIILINHDVTNFDEMADIVSRKSIGDELNFVNLEM